MQFHRVKRRLWYAAEKRNCGSCAAVRGLPVASYVSLARRMPRHHSRRPWQLRGVQHATSAVLWGVSSNGTKALIIESVYTEIRAITAATYRFMFVAYVLGGRCVAVRVQYVSIEQKAIESPIFVHEIVYDRIRSVATQTPASEAYNLDSSHQSV